MAVNTMPDPVSPFIPFSDYENAESAAVKLEELFSRPELPTIRLNAISLPDADWDENLIVRSSSVADHVQYSLSALTQHIVFMLAQPTASVVRHARRASGDKDWEYKYATVRVPASLPEVGFSPCYIWQWIPPDCLHIQSSEQKETEESRNGLDAVLSPNCVFCPTANRTSGNISAKAFAYRQCMPGSQIIAILSATLEMPSSHSPNGEPIRLSISTEKQLFQGTAVKLNTGLRVPHFELHILYREHASLKHHWLKRNPHWKTDW